LAHIDSGAVYSVVPATVLARLGIEPLAEQELGFELDPIRRELKPLPMILPVVVPVAMRVDRRLVGMDMSVSSRQEDRDPSHHDESGHKLQPLDWLPCSALPASRSADSSDAQLRGPRHSGSFIGLLSRSAALGRS